MTEWQPPESCPVKLLVFFRDEVGIFVGWRDNETDYYACRPGIDEFDCVVPCEWKALPR
jgi:hypothetical protein